MPGRKFSAGSGYRYGFNGKENDKDAGESIQDYGMRIYDPRLGRFLSVDPITSKYPELTPYQFASNTPIQAIDLDGGERLDITSLNSTKREAKITITHVTQVVRTGLVTEVSSLSNRKYSSSFRNTNLYVRSIPQNGQPIEFISQADYNNGIGWLMKIEFDVTLGYVANAAAATIDAEHSTVTMGPGTNPFSSIMSFARGSVNTDNTVEINPKFDAFAINSSFTINEDYEELIAHEVGYHNMMGQVHSATTAGAAIYPTTTTLESNLHGQILSNDDNVKQMLRMNITTRQNLKGGIPSTPPPIDESIPGAPDEGF